MLDQIHPGAVRPDLQLVDGRRAEGIRRRQQHLLAVLVQVVGKFADGGRLADAVDADDQDNAGLGGEVERLVARKHLGDDLLERPLDGSRVAQAFFLYLFAQVFTDARRGHRPDVGHNQAFFQLVEKVLVNFGEGIEQCIDLPHHRVPCLF